MVRKEDTTSRGRCFQVDLVAQELAQPRLEVVVAAFEFPAEVSFEKGIGEPAGHPLFKSKGVAVAIFYWRGVTNQGADVQEHLLGRLLLAKLDVAPLGDELLRM